MRTEGHIERIAVRSRNETSQSRGEWAAWFAVLVLPIPFAGFLERQCISPMLQRAWESQREWFSVIEGLFSWFPTPSLSGDTKAFLWNSGCAAALAFPYVLLVVMGRWVWLRRRGSVGLRPLTAPRTFSVLGLVLATRLPSMVAGWGIMAGLTGLMQRDEALATRLMIVFNEFLPWFGYALDKVPAALIALAALQVSVLATTSAANFE